MALYWGVTPMLVERLGSTDAMVRQVKRLCTRLGLAPRGTPVVIVAGVPIGQSGGTNTMTVHRL
jgi:pyruvate kinase